MDGARLLRDRARAPPGRERAPVKFRTQARRLQRSNAAIWGVAYPRATRGRLGGGVRGSSDAMYPSGTRSGMATGARRHPNWMGTDVYCTILAYRTDKFGAKGPQSWRDYFDTVKFPGRRAMRRSPIDTLELALLAEGVAPAKLYPLDVDRAFKKLDQIKKSIAVWWTGGAQTSQLLQSGEVDMCPTWNARAQTVIDANSPVKISWNQGLYSIEGWGIPKGNPKAAIGRRFVAFCANAKRQAAFTEFLSYGPTNPNAYKYIKPEVAAKLPTAPNIFPHIILAKEEWWADNRQKAEERFTAWMLS